MDVYLTLDFELFLGEEAGSVQKCLVEPIERLVNIAESNEARFTIFVDTTYINRLKNQLNIPQLRNDHVQVCSLLKDLSIRGHDLQLHLHPQWLYSDFKNGRWNINQKFYKLSDVSEEEAKKIFKDGCDVIEEISGSRPIGFRAGGFSAQPTLRLKQLFEESGLVIDSSVYPGNIYHSPQQDYDYSLAPTGQCYAFSDDMCIPSPKGDLIELPLSTYNVSPLFYWKLVFQRLSRNTKHRRIGDGKSVKTSSTSIRERLTKRSNGFATIDESKISYLKNAYVDALKKGHKIFCVIGHPKLATQYSLEMFEKILPMLKKNGAVFKTISDIKNEFTVSC